MKRTSQSYIFFIAGGTAGHIFPALGMMDTLKKSGFSPVIITDNRGKQHIPNTFPYNVLSILKPKHLLFIFSFLAKNIRFIQLYKKYRPLCLMIFGGYPTLSAFITIGLFRPKIVLLEQNALLGRTHRLMMFLTKILSIPTLLLLPWEDIKNLPKINKNTQKIIVTGCPVRSPFYHLTPIKTPIHKKTLLILGGSLGAKILSIHLATMIVHIIQKDSKFQSLQIIHQIKKEDLKFVQDLYKKHKIKATVQSFFSNTPSLMQRSQAIICRAGGSTLAECQVLNLKGIFIPYPLAKDNHQTFNAMMAQKEGLGFMLLEKNLTESLLHDMLNKILFHGSSPVLQFVPNQHSNTPHSKKSHLYPNTIIAHAVQKFIL